MAAHARGRVLRRPRARGPSRDLLLEDERRAELSASKHTWNGFLERRRLLERESIAFPDSLAENARAVDVLDAGAAAWSARRIAHGEHETLPRRPRPGEPVIFY